MGISCADCMLLQAANGTGKTLLVAIILLKGVAFNCKLRVTQTLCIVPNRELAWQLTQWLRRLCVDRSDPHVVTCTADEDSFAW